jgi:hypothetical protein
MKRKKKKNIEIEDNCLKLGPYSLFVKQTSNISLDEWNEILYSDTLSDQ